MHDLWKLISNSKIIYYFNYSDIIALRYKAKVQNIHPK